MREENASVEDLAYDDYVSVNNALASLTRALAAA